MFKKAEDWYYAGMMKPTSVLFLGLWIIIVPFLGVPSPWKTVLLCLTGASLIFSYLFRRRLPEGLSGSPKATNTFAENDGPSRPDESAPQH